ncbi:MAG: Fic family protein [Agarilytica sp.]
MSERSIKSIHQLVLKNIDDENAGVYRRQNVVISGVSHTPPDHLHLREEMKSLIDKYSKLDAHPIERSAKFHADFVKIHPFVVEL